MEDHDDFATTFTQIADSQTGRSVSKSVTESIAFQNLLRDGLIERAPDSKEYWCPESRITLSIDYDEERPFVVCKSGIRFLTIHDVRRWRCNWSGLLKLIRTELDLDGPIRKQVVGRSAFIGMMGKVGHTFPVWVMRGMSDVHCRSENIQRLQQAGPNQRGVVIICSRLSSPPAIANGSNMLWLGDLLRMKSDRFVINAANLWQCTPGQTQRSNANPGRPTKPGDPIGEFKTRVRNGEALQQIGNEGEEIKKFEEKLYGAENAYSQSHIENEIRPSFNEWKANGFRRQHFDPENS